VANFTKQLVTAKMEKAGAGLGKAMKKSPIKRVNKRVKKEVLTLKERVAAARKKDFAQAQEIIDSLRCP
jgi:adenine specific DNA methylase Mod